MSAVVQLDGVPNGLWDATWEQYIALRRWSNASLGTMLKDGPRAAKARFEGKDVGGNTRAMRMGTLCHCAILEGPEVFAKRFLVANKRTKKGKEAAEQAEANGVMVIRAEEYDTAMSMAEAVAEQAKERAEDGDSRLASMLAAPGLCEQSMLWTDPVTDLELKGRADKLVPDADMVIDLKTTSSWRSGWDGFDRVAYKFGYERQAWLYTNAAEQIYGRPFSFELIVVHSSPPFEVALYRFNLQEYELGMEQSRRAMRLVKKHTAMGKWYAPEERGVNTIVYPDWVYQDVELQGVEEA